MTQAASFFSGEVMTQHWSDGEDVALMAIKKAKKPKKKSAKKAARKSAKKAAKKRPPRRRRRSP